MAGTLKQDDTEIELRSPDRRRKMAVVDPNGLTSMEIQEYKDVFEGFDKNRSGRISMAELGDMLTSMGRIIPSKKDLENIMEEIDTDKNGAIDFSEFLHFMTTERNSRKLSSDASDYGEIFDFMDINKNGFISADDLKKIMERVGQKVTNLEIEEMVDEATKGGGLISKEQFLNLMIPQRRLSS